MFVWLCLTFTAWKTKGFFVEHQHFNFVGKVKVRLMICIMVPVYSQNMSFLIALKDSRICFFIFSQVTQ